MDEYLFKNLRFLTISLNSGNGKSHPITHGYKGENKFNDIIRNIERILKFPNASDKIKLNYVITSDNYNEIDDFFELAIKWNVSFMARPVSVDFPQLRSKEVNQALLTSLNEKVEQYLIRKELSSKLSLSFQLLSRACQMGQTKLDGDSALCPCYMNYIQGYIASNGDVLLCSEGKEKPLGNLNKENYSLIWRKRENLALRVEATQMHKTNKPVFAACGSCDNVRYHSLAFHKIYSRIPLLSGRLAGSAK